jgi:glycosyltransferase involved in cell wall biosynthesis
MRILFYVGDGAWNGTARALVQAAHGLAGRGHAVTFVCPAESRLELHLTLGSFELVSFPRSGAAAAAWRLRRELSERFVEVVFVGSARDHGLAAFAARAAERGAVIRRVGHGQTLRHNGSLALRLTATGYVFPSGEELRRAALPGSARLSPRLVPLGIDTAPHADVRPAASLVLGAGGGSHRQLVCVHEPSAKASAAFALRTVALLTERHRDIRLTFVGAGSERDELRVHAAALRVAPFVTFLGARDDELEVLRAAQLGWVAAGGDDGAWAMLDFGALGIPVVAERGALSRHYVADGITGMLLPPGQPADAAGLIARLLAVPHERQSMGAAARARVAREFSPASMVSAFEEAALAAADRSKW